MKRNAEFAEVPLKMGKMAAWILVSVDLGHPRVPIVLIRFFFFLQPLLHLGLLSKVSPLLSVPLLWLHRSGTSTLPERMALVKSHSWSKM